jgi:hypothetical protein
MKILSLLALVLLTGCVKSSMAEYGKEMGDNHSAFGSTVMTPYGSGYFWRVNPTTNQSVRIARPDGTVIEITSHEPAPAAAVKK